MKRVVIIALFIFSLTGCNFNEEKIYSVDVDVILNITDMIEVEDNPGVLRYSIIRQEDLIDVFVITEIEMLTTGFAEFPYESIFVDKGLAEYETILQELFDQIADGDTLGGWLDHMVGPKAKLIVTMQNDTSTIVCEFYQDENLDITHLIIQHINEDGVKESKEYSFETYSGIFTKLSDLLKE
ncbi:MAG: hypothetical protein KQ78_00954 [Candidatus Izimaplasma bacterium HR2]|nr:MAG: hypothetical protein KQ78_00954 [Candidatus Izimaplasma bacterium HR2]